MYRKLFLTILIFILMSCENQNSTDNTNNLNENIVNLSTTPKLEPPIIQPPTVTNELSKHEILLINFMKTLQQRDGQGLHHLLLQSDPEYYINLLHDELNFTNDFLKYLKYDVDLDSLDYKLMESNESASVYQLIGFKGDNKVTFEDPIHIFNLDNDMISLRWSYIRYLPFVEMMSSEYISLILESDIKGLVNFMNQDDLPYDERNAKKIIDNYNIFFDDITSIQLEYRGHFQFYIRDDSNNIHTIKIIYGDGLMGIRDAFADVEENFEDTFTNQLHGMIEDESIKVIISADIDKDKVNYNTTIEFINKTDRSMELIEDCGLFISNDQFAPKNNDCLAVESMLLKKNGNQNLSIILTTEFLNANNRIITIRYRQDEITKDLQMQLSEDKGD